MSMIEPQPNGIGPGIGPGIGIGSGRLWHADAVVVPAVPALGATPEPDAVMPEAMPEASPKERRTGPRWFLRDATADLHEVADSMGSGFDLSTTSDYARFLRAHARALLPLEAALASAGIEDFLPDWPARRRGDALLADLAALGQSVPAAPRFRLHTAAAALGAGYVLEGSRMGNGLLLRGLKQSGLPTAYLGHAGAAGGWPGFLLRLEEALRLPDLWPAAAEGARAAFTLFLSAMRQEAGPHPA